MTTLRLLANSSCRSQIASDLSGYLCCDASRSDRIANAIKRLERSAEVKVVSMDGITPILNAIKEGVIDASSATIPRMQGSMSVLIHVAGIAGHSDASSD